MFYYYYYHYYYYYFWYIDRSLDFNAQSTANVISGRRLVPVIIIMMMISQIE